MSVTALRSQKTIKQQYNFSHTQNVRQETRHSYIHIYIYYINIHTIYLTALSTSFLEGKHMSWVSVLAVLMSYPTHWPDANRWGLLPSTCSQADFCRVRPTDTSNLSYFSVHNRSCNCAKTYLMAFKTSSLDGTHISMVNFSTVLGS